VALSDTFHRLSRKLRGEDGPLEDPVAEQPSESDVGQDPAVASSRAGGGGHADHPGDTEVFVGRAAGLDEGYAEETGAEARREQEQERER
jgi:hypothetical protein